MGYLKLARDSLAECFDGNTIDTARWANLDILHSRGCVVHPQRFGPSPIALEWGVISAREWCESCAGGSPW